MADGPQLCLQPDNKETSSKLQALAEAVDWVYSAFWKFNHETRLLAWQDGFYNGPSPTTMDELLPQMDLAISRSERRQALDRKQLQALASGCHKSQMEFYQLNSDDLSGSEWFYLMSTGFTFPPGIGMPGRVLLSGEHEWLNEAGHAGNVQFVRSAMALGGGIQTVVCIAVNGGVVELGTHRLNSEDAGLVAVVKQMFGSPQPMCYLPNSPAASLYNSGPWEGSPRSILPRRLEFPGPNILQQAHQALFQSVVGAATSALTEQETASHDRLQGHVHEVEEPATDSPIDCAALSRSVPAHIISSVWDDDMPSLKELPSPPHEPAPILTAPGSGSVEDPSCLTPVAPHPRSKRARLTPEALPESSPSDSCASEVSSLLRSTLSPLVIPLRADPGAPSGGKDAHCLSKLLAPKQELSPLKPSSQVLKHTAKQERSHGDALSMETSEITMSADEMTASFQHSGPSASGPLPSTPYHPEKRKRGRPRKIVHSTVIYHCMAERQRRIKENEQFETLRALVPTTPKCTKSVLLADTIDYIEAMQSIISRHGLESKLIALIGGGDELENDLPPVSATASCGTAASCGVASQVSQKTKKLKPKKSKGHSQSTLSLHNGDDFDDLSTEYTAGSLHVQATAEPGSSVAQVMVSCEEKPGVLMDVSCAVEKLQLPLEMASFSTRTEGGVKIFVANMEVVLNPNQTTSDLAKSLRVALERSTTMQPKGLKGPKIAKATSLAQKLKR